MEKISVGRCEGVVWGIGFSPRLHFVLMDRITYQLLLATILTLAGVALLFSGLYIAPLGIIDNSVLVAFGEIATFAGSLCGIDYHYRKNCSQK